MAIALIHGRESVISQIHSSWNEFRRTDEAMVLMFGEVDSQYRNHHDIPLAKDFTESDSPWTTKETVLEKNAVHANNLIRYYIGLNIDVAERMPIWQLFEIGTGIVGKIKEQIKLLKRIQAVLKLVQQLEVHEPLPNTTSLFTHTGNLSLDEIEDDFKVKVKEAKAAKKLELKVAKQAAKVLATKKKIIATIVKKNDSRTDGGSLYMDNINTTLSVEDLREVLKMLPLLTKANKTQAKKAAKEAKAKAKEAEKQAKKAAKNLAAKHANFAKKVLSLLKFAQANNYTVEDIVVQLKAQVE
jgi:hypothetical protein|uniref:Uncharacterized protein n=1 Tax=viral metagenome TaxID=1070528 RepID=A0A6C0AKZ0_9ZZZZ